MTQSYDPYKLVDEVATMLAERGLHPEQLQGRADDRLVGASTLLRGLGIAPAMAPEDALDLDGHQRYNSRVHGD